MYILQWQSTREPRLKVEQANPLGRNSDSHHILNHGSKLRYPGFTLLLSEIAFRSQGIPLARFSFPPAPSLLGSESSANPPRIGC